MDDNGAIGGKGILVVDDNERLYGSLAINFRESGYESAWARNGAAAVRLLEERPFAAVLLDLALGEENGIDILPRLLRIRPGTPIIIITGFGTFEAAVKAIKLGAYDFLPKPLDIDNLLAILADILTLAPAGDAGGGMNGTAKMIANSPAMRKLCEKAQLVAKSELPVLITGESGAGKELMAGFIHAHSGRHGKAFLSVNCSAIADSLADSELFGHAKGAFTGAADGRPGFFERADGGTLHLDEIGDMSPGIQAKILRVLEDSRVRRVGGNADLSVDVRLIASTNKDLSGCIREGTFRRDLFYRLNAVYLRLPPLRERRADIPALAEAFLMQAAEGGAMKRFSVEAMNMLMAHDWPGNIRELRNLVKICALIAPGMIIEAHDIPSQNGDGGDDDGASGSTSSSVRLDDNERSLILKALQDAGGNKQAAAQNLGISRRTLYYKLERYGIS